MHKALLDTTAYAVARIFLRLILRLLRKSSLICRGCGVEIPLDYSPLFVENGCLVCGSKKLNAR